MPTDKPKVNLVFANDESKKILIQGLSDCSEVNGASKSWNIERILIDSLLPKDGSLARDVLERLYLGESTVQKELSFMLEELASKIDPDKEANFRPIVEYVWRQMPAMGFDAGQKDSGTVEHLKGNWMLVCDKLHEVHEESPDSPAGESAGVDEGLAYSLIQYFDTAYEEIKPKKFFDIVMWNWPTLYDSASVYFALSDVVALTADWPETARARDGLRVFLKSIDDVY